MHFLIFFYIENLEILEVTATSSRQIKWKKNLSFNQEKKKLLIKNRENENFWMISKTDL